MKHSKPSRKPKPATAKRAAKAPRKTAAPAERKAARRTPPAAPAASTSAEGREDAIEFLAAAGAQALGLTIDPAWRDGVALNLRLILRLGALVDEFALPDDIEPAPIFHA